MEVLLSQDSDLYLEELCIWLAIQHNILISTSALSWTLNSVGLSRKMLQKLASERNELYRAEFLINIIVNRWQRECEACWNGHSLAERRRSNGSDILLAGCPH